SAARKRVLAEADELVKEHLRQGIIPGARFRKVSVSLLLQELITKRLALPTYVLAYRYRGNLYRALVHGQNRNIVLGSVPISWGKVALVFATAIFVLALIGYLLYLGQ